MNNGASDLPSSLNLPFIEGLYSNYVKDPGSVMPEWRQYFEAMEKGDGAAKDTAALIEESIAKSNEGNRKLQLVAGSIQEVTGSATQVKVLVDEVDVGSQEQSRGIEQIATAVTQMEAVTQRSAANAEESAAASEELAAQAQTLYDVAERVRALVNGRSATSTRGTGMHRLASPTPVSSHKAGATMVPSKVPVADVSRSRDAFPLDDHDSNF